MRRVIRRQIRHKEDGLDLAVDFNADVAINVGRARPAAADERPKTGPQAQEDPDPTTETQQEGTQP